MSPDTHTPEAYESTPSFRMALRRHIVASLKGRTLAGLAVFDSRSTDIRTDEQPALNVLATEEGGSNFSASPKSFERTLSVYVDVYCAGVPGDENPSELVDALCSQVEQGLAQAQFEITQGVRNDESNPGLGFNPTKSGYRGTSMDADADGKELVAGARITWELVYVTEVDESAFDSANLTPFDIAEAAIDFDGDGAADTIDTVEQEQE